jgi:uncharacterized protein (TIGR01777 family)
LNILLAGGTGLVGRIIVPALIENAHQVTVLTRYPRARRVYPEMTLLEYDPYHAGQWQFQINEYDVVINLAGLSIFRCWTRSTKKNIIQSRVVTTQNLVKALALKHHPHTTLISVSGAGYYGFQGDEMLDEGNPAGNDFLAGLAARWESAALEAQKSGVRVVICRLGHVFSCRDGVFPQLVRLAKCHLGCPWGNGSAWTSWVHEADVARAFVFLLNNRGLSGPFNLTSPTAVRNSEMMGLISGYLQVKPWLSHLPAWLLKLAAGEFASVFLTGQRAIPRRLTEAGFNFEYPRMQPAVEQLISYGYSGWLPSKGKTFSISK